MLFTIYKTKHFHASSHFSTYKSNQHNVYGGRAFLSSSADGSLTLEASMALPLYIFFLTALIYILNILDLQNSLYAAMEEAARSSSAYAYMSHRLDSLSGSDTKNKDKSNSQHIVTLAKGGFSYALLKNAFMTDAVKELADNSYINGGHNGIRFVISEGDTDGDINFNIIYKLSLPFFPKKLLNINVTQRCCFRPFAGEDITAKSGGYTEYVYVSNTGSVYHTSPYCSYLSKYVDIIPKSKLEGNLADTSGYAPCPHCAFNSEPGPACFMCPGSKTYHNRIDCMYLNVSVYKVPLDSAKHLHLCTRCEKGVD